MMGARLSSLMLHELAESDAAVFFCGRDHLHAPILRLRADRSQMV